MGFKVWEGILGYCREIHGMQPSIGLCRDVGA